jgi:electron transfer flavoprotein alpha subunit
MAVLVIADHHDGQLRDTTHKTVTAAQKLSGDIDILVAGQNVDDAAAAAAKIAGVRKVLAADRAALGQGLA